MTHSNQNRSDGGLSYTDRQKLGLGKPDPAGIAVLPGLDTLPRIESPPLVAERYRLSLEAKRVDRKLAEIDPILKQRTGDRQVGDYLVSVSSFTVERVDTAAVKELLGPDCPLTKSVSVRLTVVPA